MSKIVLEDFNEGEGYYKVNLAYLNKEQVEEIEALVSRWKPTDEDIKSCIGMCLTDVSEQRFKDYGTNLRDCLAWLEKQGETSPVLSNSLDIGKDKKNGIIKAKEINIEEYQEHKVSEVICVKCGKRWVAVRPSTTKLKDLECPNCGAGYVIETGEEINTGEQ